MSIFSPNIILSEKEELELYLGKKMSKNEYNNFSSNITSLSETIGKNPKLFKSFISGLISETETEKVKPVAPKPVAPKPVASQPSSSSSKASPSASRASSSPSSLAAYALERASSALASSSSSKAAPYVSQKIKCIYDLKKFLIGKNIINPDATINRELTNDEYRELLDQDKYDKTYIDDCLKLIGLKLNGLSLEVHRDEMLKLNNCRSTIGKYLQEKQYLDFSYNRIKDVIGINEYNKLTKLFKKNSVDDCLKIFGLEKESYKQQQQQQQQIKNDRNTEINKKITDKQNEIRETLKNRLKLDGANEKIENLKKELKVLETIKDDSNFFDKKYYSQTADMQQKYLKYKNKYLSLKQELGV